MAKNRVITVQGIPVTVSYEDIDDYICITDIAAAKSDNSRAADVIKNWMRNRSTLEFLGTWEQIYNPNFKVVEFDHFKMEAGLPTFTMSVTDWVDSTDAIGIYVKRGKYGGTFAHKDIAFEFASWLSPEFKLYVIQEFQRLKKEEAYQNKIDWHANRELAKVNYIVHTDAIKTNLIPTELTAQQTSIIYASEADVLNMALFGMTAKQWRENNPDKKGNIRDYASITELICLSNMENINAVLIEDGLSQKERLIKLNKIAIHQMSILEIQTTTVLK